MSNFCNTAAESPEGTSGSEPAACVAHRFLRNAEKLRLRVRWSIARLAGEARVSRENVRNIEVEEAVSNVLVHKAFNALNDQQFQDPLRSDDHIFASKVSSSPVSRGTQ